MVPFSAYAGTNSGIPIDALTTTVFRNRADWLFGFTGSEKQARTGQGWLTPERIDDLLEFCFEVAGAYQLALATAPRADPVT